MAKPICFLKFNDGRMSGPGGRQMSIGELFETFQKMMPDYHVLCSFSDNVDGIYDVQVFHEKDFTEIQYEELKQLIEDSLNSQKQNQQ